MSDDVATVHVTVPGAEAELASDVLWGAGAVAIEERPIAGGAGRRTDGGTIVLVAAPAAGGAVDALVVAVGGRWPAEVVAVDLGAALDAWRVHAQAVRVGPLVVRPPWVPSSAGGADGALDIVIDPGRAFGSGAHVSTRLALTLLVGLVQGGERVLDLGCGSGVLAVAALRLGAASAVAVDTDPQAVAATRRNAARNGVADRLVVHEGDAAARSGGADGEPGGVDDVVAANMLLPDLTAAAGAIARSVASGGAVVLSGVLADQVDDLAAIYAAEGLAVEGVPLTAEGWAALALRRARP